MFPLSQFFQEAEDVLCLPTLVLLERTVVAVKLLRKRSYIVFDLLEDHWVYIELDVDLTILLLFGTQVGHLQFDFAEFGNDIMEPIAEYRVVLGLVDRKVEFLEKFVFALDQFFFADAEEDGDLGSQSPELFVLDYSCRLRVILLPEINTVFKLENVDRVVLNLVVVIIRTGHCRNQQVHHQEHHCHMKTHKIWPCHPTPTSLTSIQAGFLLISD